MIGIVAAFAPVFGAAAVYVDATDRDADWPIWWTALTLAVGYLFGPILLGLFLAIYLALHAVEARWDRRRAATGV
ncbi:hypothetical protein [Natrinema sp. SYSU A 869]|uniref:hypothetical protein n=1 Tax=Natrinema sp. SYSU A 869 TaxID=2871694 RepID=UPI001CA3C463|nr:hypothetical protein [Natrinema sp. SYSU A 869]